MSDDVTPQEAAESLRRGDFTRLAPLFGDAARPDDGTGQLLAWVDAGEFDGQPDVLAEALTCACWLGQTGVAARLLDRGVDPAAGRGTGMSALHRAANRGQLAAVELLLARGAPMEQRSMYDGTALGTAVWAACQEPRGDQLGVIRALLEAGADPGAVDFPTGRPEVDVLLTPYRTNV
jgi:ankyrin repeat protein